MSDIMRYLHPAQITFVAGESPTPEKLTNWVEVQRQSFIEIARAIGNIYNLDRTLNSRGEDPHPLLLTNLTRAIGNLELLNPQWLANFKVERYAQKLTRGETEHALDFWPDLPEFFSPSDLLEIVYSAGNNGETIDSSIVLNIANVKASASELQEAGDWAIEGRTLYTVTPAAGNYFIFDGVWKLSDIAKSFSVIPHLQQIITKGEGLSVTKVTDSSGTYYLLSTPNILTDYDGNDAHPSMYGQQIPLPKIIQYAADELIPEGLVYLWDLGSPPSMSQARLVEGATFYGYGNEYTVIVKNVQLEENNGRYFLVTAAEGLAYAIHTLRRQLSDIFRGIWPVYPYHHQLRGLRFTGFDNFGNQLSWSAFPKSRIKNHDHTMYLHRLGYDPQDVAIWRNAMVGDLMMASTDPHNNYDNLVKDSRAIIFGGAEGPRIFYRAASNDLSAGGILLKSHDHSGGQLGAPVKVAITGEDIAPDYLINKLIAGDGISIHLAKRADGGDVIRVVNTGGGEGGGGDSFTVKVDDTDTVAAFLKDKIVPGEGVSVSIEEGSGGNKVLRISIAGAGTLKTQTFTSNGTFTVPANIRQLTVVAAGGGGGGGAGAYGDINTYSYTSGAGGSSGEVVREVVHVEPGWNIPVYVGKGGNGGTFASISNITLAKRGEDTYFGGFIIAQGGNPGNNGLIISKSNVTFKYILVGEFDGNTIKRVSTNTTLYEKFLSLYDLYRYRETLVETSNSSVNIPSCILPDKNMVEALGMSYPVLVYVLCRTSSTTTYTYDPFNQTSYPVTETYVRPYYGALGGLRVAPRPPFDLTTHPEDCFQGYPLTTSSFPLDLFFNITSYPPYVKSRFLPPDKRTAGGAQGTADPLKSPYLVCTAGGHATRYRKLTIDKKTVIGIDPVSLAGAGGGGSYWGNGGNGAFISTPFYSALLAGNGGTAAGGGGGCGSSDANCRKGGNGGNGICIVAWYE